MRAFAERIPVHRDALRRGVLVVALTAVGVGLALTWSTVGIADSDPSVTEGPSIRVDDDVTVASRDEAVTVIEDVSSVDAVSVRARDDGTIHLESTERGGLNEAERRRALAIARDNETVRQAVASLDDPALAVEPVVEIRASSFRTVEIDGTATDVDASGANGAETYAFTVNASSVEQDDGTVVVDRTQEYVDGVASVRLSDERSGETRYTIRVDLAAGTVTDVTNWEMAESAK